MSKAADQRVPLLVEYAFMLATVLGALRLGWLTFQEGYYPQPFFLDPDDTWRDWFSVAIWAHEPGAYDSWLSIYPPLSFAFLKVMGVPACYDYAPVTTVRDCDWLGVAVLHAIYVINIVLTSMTFLKIDRRTALPRAVTLSICMPMLFGLERGNLVLLCFTFVLLGFGPLIKSARWRWFCVALAVNLKVYLIASVFTQLLRRRWLAFEGTLLFIAAIWLVSFVIYGAGTPMDVYANIQNWAGGSTPHSVLDVWYPNTYLPLRYILGEAPSVPVNLFLGSDVINAALVFMPATTMLAQGAIIVAAAFAWMRPEVVPPYRLAFFGASLAMVTSETSLYTQPIVYLFVFMERWKGWTRPAAIVSCYIMCIPGDIILSSQLSVRSFSFVSQRWVLAEYGLGLGMLVRPFLLMLPAYFLSIATVRDVWIDIRYQGWSKRRRFSGDWAVLPGVLAPKKVIS